MIKSTHKNFLYSVLFFAAMLFCEKSFGQSNTQKQKKEPTKPSQMKQSDSDSIRKECDREQKVLIMESIPLPQTSKDGIGEKVFITEEKKQESVNIIVPPAVKNENDTKTLSVPDDKTGPK